MNWVKSIVFGAIAMFFFIGSIGIGIFSHVCAEDGTNISYFAPSDDDCGKHTQDTGHHADSCNDCCCDEGEESEDDCCSTSSELVKVNLDYLNKIQVKAILFEAAEVQPVWIVDLPVDSDESFVASGSDPPPKLRKEILTDFQQWLI